MRRVVVVLDGWEEARANHYRRNENKLYGSFVSLLKIHFPFSPLFFAYQAWRGQHKCCYFNYIFRTPHGHIEKECFTSFVIAAVFRYISIEISSPSSANCQVADDARGGAHSKWKLIQIWRWISPLFSMSHAKCCKGKFPEGHVTRIVRLNDIAIPASVFFLFSFLLLGLRGK